MIIGLDLETTGLNAQDDRIIELCAGIYTDDGRLIKTVTLRFNPCRPIDKKAQAIHKITIEELLSCPKFAEKAAQIGQLLSKAGLIVIHNAAFDAPFLKAELTRNGIKPPHVPVYDTMAESRWATFDGKVPNLGELCWALDVPYNPEEAHAADYDVDCMMKSFFKMVDKGFFSESVLAFDEIKTNK